MRFRLVDISRQPDYDAAARGSGQPEETVAFRTSRAWITALLLLSLAACGESPGKALQKARRLKLAGKTPQAIEAYQQILERHPEQAEALVALAELYLDTGEFERAKPLIDKALLAAPKEAGPHYVKGRYLLTQKLWLPAEQSLEMASRTDLFNPDILFYLGVSLEHLNELDKAVLIYKKLLNQKPDYPLVHSRLGDLYLAKNDYDRAMQEYEQAVEESPKDPRILEQLSVCYHYLNFQELAEKAATRALTMDPKAAGAYNVLGAVALANGDTKTAQERFEKAIALEPKLVAPHVNLGAIFNLKGEIDRSLEEYNKALELDPENAEVQKNLGDLYITQGNPAEALKHYRAFLELRPDDPYVSYLAAKLISLLPEEDPAEGHRLLDKFERVTGLDVAMNEARFAMTTGRSEPKGDRLDALRAKYAYLPDLLAVRALLYERQKNLERARETVEIALLMTLEPRLKEGFQRRLEAYRAGKIPPPHGG
jgi:tetratricopeptide (TPR) repeat protein